MKKRHTWKVGQVPTKEKEMLKMFNDPKFIEKMKELSKLANCINNTNSKIQETKYDSLGDWAVFVLSMMSQTLFDKTKETGFQQKFLDMVEQETNKENMNNETDEEATHSK